MSKPTLIPIDKIQNRFDVRQALDDDLVIHLAEMYQAGEPIPPITVVPLDDGNYAFIDGRHRAEARVLLGLKDVPAIVRHEDVQKNLLPLYAEALKSNWGGSKPPTREDISHTITRMIQNGAKEPLVTKLLPFIPASVIRRYYKNTLGNITRKRVQQALVLVAKGQTVAEAARLINVDVRAVAEAVEGRKKKFGHGGVLAANKGAISQSLRATSLTIGKRLQILLQQVESGEVGTDVFEQVLDTWERSVNSSVHRIRDWRERLRTVTEAPASNGEVA
jgi:hypothetical protein